MSGPRGQANHELYLARILLSSWRKALAAEDDPALALGQAFLPGIRGHLINAYGWFLLEISGTKSLPSQPPRNCSELPEPEPGKAVAGEIQEFRQLEQGGWLAAMLAVDGELATATVRSRSNLASPAPDLPDPESAPPWLAQLNRLFARMSDSLDEY